MKPGGSAMSITLTEDLENDVNARSKQLGLSPDELVHRAVTSYLQIEPELAAELRDWQQSTWNSLAKLEESLSK
jgi:hypothetical protein